MRALFSRSLLLLVVFPCYAGFARGAAVDFLRDARPILARHCFKCHGPDDKTRKAKLRLDVRASAVGATKSGAAAVVPGKPEVSELVKRIFATDATEVMPPPATKDFLTGQEKQILKRWIAEGAEYKPHWAFVPPRQAPLPTVKQTGWPKNAVDAFVLARLEAEGLRPAPEADRHTLARRVSLDLIGLPPTPAEADAFVNDPAADAYEKLVDRLLASPHYGERWARRWLDLARYADTNGYEKDRPRSIWPYRDWVIQALNADMPFDRFTVEQLAGDMLPRASLEQRIATGFHRNTMLNEEGGIDPLEFRFHALTDRAATTGKVWLGLTIGCAQCHTHKYDPITQKEYYQMLAFLNNADEPDLDVPSAAVAGQRATLEKQISGLEADLPNRFPVDDKSSKDDKRPVEVRRRERLEQKFHAWLEQEAGRAAHWTVLRPAQARANLPLLTVLDDHSILASGDQTKSATYDLKFQGGPRGITAIRLDVLPDERLPRHGPGRVYYEGPIGDFHLSEIAVAASGKKVPLARATHSFAKGKFPASAALDGNPQTGWSIDGGQGRAHSAVFNLAAPLADATELNVHMLFERYYAAGLGRFRISVTTDTRPAEARALPFEIEKLLLVPASERAPEQRQQLLTYYLRVAPELAKSREEIDKLRKQLPAYPTTLVMAERPPENPRPTFLYHRGEFLQPAERVEPDVLAVLHPFPKDAPRTRLTFARWLAAPENPLVGRVTVNRQWSAFFGRGLVRTAEDFGFQGELPTHPELLDWLAVELVRDGWSLKKLHRRIVLSATYRQASRVTPELAARDAGNRLLARGPRVRLEAELIRDSALWISGLLSPTIGGPSVFPPQPANITTEGAYGALKWKVSEGADRYRRGLYTFSKRTTPYAMFATFDAPSGEACVAQRDVSNSPLQALTLLNDTVFVEASQALGRMLAARTDSIENRVEYLFRRTFTRPPSAEEKDLLLKFYKAQKHRFETRELDAQAVAGAGAGDVNDRAAWTALARALFNLDEAIARG